MSKQTIIQNVFTDYGKYGITWRDIEEEIEPLIDKSLKDGLSCEKIYFYLQSTLADMYGLKYFWCTSRQMGRAFGISDEKMLEINKKTSKELGIEKIGLDEPFRFPVKLIKNH